MRRSVFPFPLPGPALVQWLLLSTLLWWHCEPPPPPPKVTFLPAKPLVYCDSILRIPPPPRQLSVNMIPAPADTQLQVPFDRDMLLALKRQSNYLKDKNPSAAPAKGMRNDELLHTLRLIQAGAMEPGGGLQRYFEYYQLNTEYKLDKVRITGYYTPTIDASRERSAEYPVPVLRWPKDDGIPVPSPAAIKAGALGGRGLEIAWLKSQKELENAQLQGSCLLQFPDGQHIFLGFGGSVKGAGGSYVFFKKIGQEVLGAGSFPLTAGYSAAIDPAVVPIGGALLAELPICDKKGNATCYEYKIIFAQDRGGAIKTTKRLDLYCGIGKKGLEAAKRVNNYGRLWLLLPKRM